MGTYYPSTREYRVSKGDTLGKIVSELNSKYSISITVNDLAKYNGIKNINAIQIGQILKVDPKATASSSASSSSPSNMPVIENFGIQSGTDNTLYATWKWDRENTENYKVIWQYDSGEGIWFTGSDSTINEKQSTYSIPANAVRVLFKVQPISEKHTVNRKEVSYWTADWSKERIHEVATGRPHAPGVPEITIVDRNKLIASFDNLDYQDYVDYIINTAHTASASKISMQGVQIQFQIVQNNSTVFACALVYIKDGRAAYGIHVKDGNVYKVRCRAARNSIYSPWSEYTDNISTRPPKPATIKSCKVILVENGLASVLLEWDPVSMTSYDFSDSRLITYKVEYVNKLSDFDNINNIQTQDGIEHSSCTLTNLEVGKEYFFRVRAVNSIGESDPTDIASVSIGTRPSPPTTWSSVSTAVVGEEIELYWTHNASDNSDMTAAELTVQNEDTNLSATYNIKARKVEAIPGSGIYETVLEWDYDSENPPDMPILNNPPGELSVSESGSSKTYICNLDTSLFEEGLNINWKVKTKGLTLGNDSYRSWSDDSVSRKLKIYSQPTMNLMLTSYDNHDIITELDGEVSQFPFYIKCNPGPVTQRPIGYHVTIRSTEEYETTDNVGNLKTVNIGEIVYQKYIDINEPLVLEISAGDADLRNNITYEVSCTVAMNSGLNVDNLSDPLRFKIAWDESAVLPNAEIGIDPVTLSATIMPYCDPLEYELHLAEFSNNEWIDTGDVIDYEIYNISPVVDNSDEIDSGNADELIYAYTNDGYQVFSGVDDPDNGNTINYIVYSERPNVSLAVYRRNFDGSFTLIEDEIDNSGVTCITDPHPSLNFARYRIVAISNLTGAVSYYDTPSYDVGETSIIIQWDEAWRDFNIDNSASGYYNDESSEKPWAGSMIKLPYNVDISESYSTDVSFINYIGRTHPVSYHGTHIETTQNWNTDIPKSDIETIYALRRLANWNGNVYVREPSGIGHWASIKVSFSQKHKEVTIPVSFEVKRVEGGV